MTNGITDKLKKVKEASLSLSLLSENKKNNVLYDCARLLKENAEAVLVANEKDLISAEAKNMSEGLSDRLKLTKERVVSMAEGLINLASLPDPVGEISGMLKRPNGLMIGKKRVPLGVVGIIYEARPNVTSDAFGICFKSGNASVLRGGSDSVNSCVEIVKIIKNALTLNGVNENCVFYIEDTGHDGIKELIRANDYVDLVIPRGGENLINFVVNNATVPAIHTGTGNCHIYVDAFADLKKAANIIVNAKTTRLGVCNACESLVIHSDIMKEFIPMLHAALLPYKIEIRADERAREIGPSFEIAAEDDWGREYLDRIISLKCADGIEDAISHINKYGTKHSEAIITENLANAELFLNAVDAACVYVNASTRFTDGGEFGFGAEIGISTQKIHARGPMGLKELTCEKYIILGNGQVRE